MMKRGLVGVWTKIERNRLEDHEAEPLLQTVVNDMNDMWCNRKADFRNMNAFEHV